MPSMILPITSGNQWNLPRAKNMLSPACFYTSVRTGAALSIPSQGSPSKKPRRNCVGVLLGDPYGNRTHVTAVKGRCLNRLTNGPGSGDLIRTGDIPGMNRLLYQLSYAAIFSFCRISFVIISTCLWFVKRNVCIFPLIFGNIGKKGWIYLKIIKNAAQFLLGGGAYVGIELLWRGRSHASMFLAGGISYLLLGKLQKATPRLPLAIRGFAGAGVITMVELAAGLMFNRRYAVWDYRDQLLNFHGQICLPFYFLWVPLSLCAMGVYHVTDRWLTAGLGQGGSSAPRRPCKSPGRRSKDR